MNTYTETIGNKLNDLLEKNYDAEKGFKKAAENTAHLPLKGYFKTKALERYNFGNALKTEIRSFGQEVDEGDSITAKTHRAWMDIKAMFASDNDEAMLEEAIRGEKASLAEYQDVLQETTLPTSTEILLEKQKNTIASGLKTIKHLEDIS